MPIRLHDSLTRQAKELRPTQGDGIFRFYNCGPTVYAPAHIGNFRTFVINDVLRRLLEIEFGADKVRHVRNLTDVDDKTIRRAREEGRPLADVTRQWTEKFHADCAALNCLPPHVEPTATGHIREQVDMIDVLMKKGNAYRAADGSVYFKVSSFDHYGALSRVKERELQAGSPLKAAAVDADEKEDVSDFALWKAHKPDDGANAWESPWGSGRPGWHIECSAMSKKHLGDTIDLHTGGVDLLFPHHENEIAQSECCNGTLFAHHWYHSEHLLVDGKKMSKSLGNLYTLDDLTAKGFSPMAVRYALLAGHPRKQLNFTLDSLHAAESALRKIAEFDGKLTSHLRAVPTAPEGKFPWARFEPVRAALCDDLNFPQALGLFFGIINELDVGAVDQIEAGHIYISFYQLCRRLFGFPAAKLASGVCRITTGASASAHIVEYPPQISVPTKVATLGEKRWAARTAKDWAAADALRKELAAAGWSMLDGKDGYKLEPLKK